MPAKLVTSDQLKPNINTATAFFVFVPSPRTANATMHPAVQIQSLQALPLSIRRIATVACGHNRSLEDVERANDLLVELSEPHRKAFLPVFFANLDPADIPTPEQFELFHPHTRDNISRAVLSLDTIFHIRIEMGTYALMCVTPGFRVVLGKIWMFLPQVSEPNRLEMVLNDLRGFLADCGATDPKNLAEIVEGAGGTLGDVADLVVKFIHTAIERVSPLGSNSNVSYIHSLLCFVAEADLYPKAETQWLLVPLGPLCATLFKHGFVVTLVTAIMSLATTSTAETGLALDECFMILRRILLFSGCFMLEEAQDTDLLRAIVTCATLPCARKINHHLRDLLRRAIPSGLIYYYVVVQLQSSRAAVEELVSTDAFKNSSVYGEWEHFMTVTDDRFDVLADVAYPAEMACDNLKCDIIDEKPAFERCSGCKSVYYCSRECQIADWREGSHRKACRSYESASLTLKATAELSKPIFTVRERAFIRALLHHDYTMHASSICKKQVEFMAAHPTCDLLITLFDYCAGHLQIEVHSVAHSPLSTVLQEAGEEWTDFIARAARSEGRFQLHVMRVLDGTATPHWVIPLRCSSSYMFDHLRDLVQQPINEGIMDEISDLLEEDQDVVVIH
ncbi:hypothetical protein C8R44DRAFT_746254 [Mycena epipterygia]|nr:hypothetical protein C8R44DRAFT_746254 [Mycena epipterygia]